MIEHYDLSKLLYQVKSLQESLSKDTETFNQTNETRRSEKQATVQFLERGKL